ncbi:MAG: NAD(P)-dependent oxidoreductase [Eubacteriales bacterium]|nr:NAD(P)-dependent oxidoreductase [Eubacteriales bacterium]
MKIAILEGLSVGEDMVFTPFQNLGEVVIYPKTSAEEMPARVEDADIIVANKLPMDEETLKEARNLKLICLTATGINNLDREYLKKRGIAACNVPAYSTNAVAQHTFALLFYVWEKLRYYDEYVKSGEYTRAGAFSCFPERFYELSGKTWGIIGLGAIGRKVAQIAQAFDCRVICYSASGGRYDSPYEQVDFDTILRESDILSIHAPLNAYTENLIDAEALGKMKNTAVLVNVARGPIVEQEALYTALTENWIAGAALDVLKVEPMAPDNPLAKIRDSRKLVITPHMAWAPVETRFRCVNEVVKNIEAFLEGKERNRVC